MGLADGLGERFGVYCVSQGDSLGVWSSARSINMYSRSTMRILKLPS